METDRTMASALFQNGSFHRMQSGTVCLCNERNRGNRRIRQIPIFLTKSSRPGIYKRNFVEFLETAGDLSGENHHCHSADRIVCKYDRAVNTGKYKIPDLALLC